MYDNASDISVPTLRISLGIARGSTMRRGRMSTNGILVHGVEAPTATPIEGESSANWPSGMNDGTKMRFH